MSVLLQLAMLVTPLAADPTELRCRIRAKPLVDRTNVEVAMQFTAPPRAAVTVKLPTDFYGSPPLHQWVPSFAGEGECSVEVGRDASERIVHADASGRVAMIYVLAYDPHALADSTFGPNVSAENFHLAGCQWLVRIGDLAERRSMQIAIEVPDGWRAYSSLGADPSHIEVTKSYDEMITTAIGAVASGYQALVVRSRPVSVSVHGRFEIPTPEIVAAVSTIVALQREWFDDDSATFYHVAVNLKEGNIAGTCIDNLFVCFLKSDITRDELNVLLAHEMFHNWLGNKLSVRADGGDSATRFQWFHEGVNDYLARKLLLESGLIDAAKFAALVNRDIVNLADNPNRSATLAAAIAAQRAGSFDTAFTKVAYYRGALIALRWEAVLRKRDPNHQLADLIRELYEVTENGTRPVSDQQLFLVAANYGLDVKQDCERFIVRGEPIPIDAHALGDRFTLHAITTPAYQVGFALEASRRSSKITAVDAAGPAWVAGLRDGMQLVGTENANRFGNAWHPDRPLVIKVREGGAERSIAYFPRGAARQLFEFVAQPD